MKELLLKAKKVVATANGKELSSEAIKTIETDYAKIVIEGLRHHASLSRNVYKKAPGKNRPGMNLLLRLAEKIDETLAFVHASSRPIHE